MASSREILINIITKGDAAGAQKILTNLDQVAEAADRAGKKLSLSVTAPLTAMAAAAIAVTTNFDTAFREVTTLIDGSAESIAVLRQDVRDLSADLGIDLVDTTKAAYNALSAGVPQDNLISFLEKAAKTGIAGVASTNESVELLTGLMNTYGISFEHAGEVSDQLFTTVKNGVTTIPKLAQALGQVAPTAATAGVELEDLLAAMATITKQTGNTAAASTGLSAAIISLLNPTETMTGLYKELGVESGRQLIAQNGLAGALELVAQKTDGNDKAFFRALGSVEAYRAAVNLTGENAQKAASDLDAMADSAGKANEAFDKMNEGPERTFALARAAGVELLNVLGDQLLPTVITLTEGLTDLATVTGDLPPELINVGIAFGTFAAASGPALIVAGSFIKNFRLLQSVAPAAAAAIAAAGPIAAAGVAAFGVGQFADDLLGLSDAIASTFEALDSHNEGLAEVLEENRQAIADQVQEIENATDAEAARNAIISERGTYVQQLNAARSSGDAETIAQLESQITKYDLMQAAIGTVLARNRARTIAAAEAAAAEAEISAELAKQTDLQQLLNELSDDQKRSREELIETLRIEAEILQAKLDGDTARVAKLEQQKSIQAYANTLLKDGLLTEKEALTIATRMIELRTQSNDKILEGTDGINEQNRAQEIANNLLELARLKKIAIAESDEVMLALINDKIAALEEENRQIQLLEAGMQLYAAEGDVAKQLILDRIALLGSETEAINTRNAAESARPSSNGGSSGSSGATGDFATDLATLQANLQAYIDSGDIDAANTVRRAISELRASQNSSGGGSSGGGNSGGGSNSSSGGGSAASALANLSESQIAALARQNEQRTTNGIRTTSTITPNYAGTGSTLPLQRFTDGTQQVTSIVNDLLTIVEQQATDLANTQSRLTYLR